LPTTILDGQPFVLSPLRQEPETALVIGSPEYFNQMRAIFLLARELPAGFVLAVKDSVNSLGRRPENHYRHICEYKNVVCLGINEPGICVIRDASAVAIIAGTEDINSIILGKPVISVCRYSSGNNLPHAYLKQSENSPCSHLNHAGSPDADHETAARNGRIFLQSLIDALFDIGDSNYVDYAGRTDDLTRLARESLETSVPPPTNSMVTASRPRRF
jgi:hypothetical protein